MKYQVIAHVDPTLEQVITLYVANVVPCPVCSVEQGDDCLTPFGRPMTGAHQRRTMESLSAGKPTAQLSRLIELYEQLPQKWAHRIALIRKALNTPQRTTL